MLRVIVKQQSQDSWIDRSTFPPAASIRANSVSSSGLWSLVVREIYPRFLLIVRSYKSHYIHRLLVEQKEHILGESAIVPNIFVGLVLLPEHNSRVAGMPHKYLAPPETRMIFARSYS